MKRLKLGSLFDGSGGFPLAGVINGIEPIWSSEIEPYPLKVTALRFPTVKQLGDVTKIDGAAVDPVDIITFGSPCQDLSVAGKQAGIHNGERSNLFFEAIRIIKEMRNGTANEFPRWAVWENVQGAFSSNGGEDFLAVIEALAGVVQDGLDIPRPEKWPHAGGVAGNGWSLAWRVYDAQYWGVPQRRKRIYLIADFRAERADKILFERESVSGHPETGREAGQGTADDAERGAGGSDSVKCLNPWDSQTIRQYDADGVSPALSANTGGGLDRHGVCYAIEWNTVDRNSSKNGKGYCEDVSPTLNTQDRHAVCALEGNGARPSHQGPGYSEDGVSYTLNSTEQHAVAFQQNQRDEVRNMGEKAGSLTANPGMKNQNYLCYPDKAMTLTARHDSSQYVDRGQNIITYSPTGTNCGGYKLTDTSATLHTKHHYGSGGDAALCVYDARGNGDGKTTNTLNSKSRGG